MRRFAVMVAGLAALMLTSGLRAQDGDDPSLWAQVMDTARGRAEGQAWSRLEDATERVLGRRIERGNAETVLKTLEAASEGDWEAASREAGPALISAYAPGIGQYISAIQYVAGQISRETERWAEQLYDHDAYRWVGEEVEREYTRASSGIDEGAFMPSYALPVGSQDQATARDFEARLFARFEQQAFVDELIAVNYRGEGGLFERLYGRSYPAMLRQQLGHDPDLRRIFNHFYHRHTRDHLPRYFREYEYQKAERMRREGQRIRRAIVNAWREAQGEEPATLASGTDALAPCPQQMMALRDTGWRDLTCRCRPGDDHGAGLWGDGPYTDDSSVCLAARHAGVIGAEGGAVRVTNTGPRERFAASMSNGFRSSAFGRWPGSFAVSGSVTGTASSSSENGTADAYVPPCPSGLMNRRGEAYGFDCRCTGNFGSRTVWGTGPYTDDSHVCTAARHAGLIGVEGTVVRVTAVPGQARYESSTANGVTTLTYGAWPGSFTVTLAGRGAVASQHISQRVPPPGSVAVPDRGGNTGRPEGVGERGCTMSAINSGACPYPNSLLCTAADIRNGAC